MSCILRAPFQRLDWEHALVLNSGWRWKRHSNCRWYRRRLQVVDGFFFPFIFDKQNKLLNFKLPTAIKIDNCLLILYTISCIHAKMWQKKVTKVSEQNRESCVRVWQSRAHRSSNASFFRYFVFAHISHSHWQTEMPHRHTRTHVRVHSNFSVFVAVATRVSRSQWNLYLFLLRQWQRNERRNIKYKTTKLKTITSFF